MGDTEMHDRLAASPPAQATDVIARAVGAVALATLAMIHVVDLPGTLGPLPLVGAGYLGIIAAAVVVGGMMIARSHRLVWAAAGALAAGAMGGYVLTRTVGGFLGDHSDVGNWRCPLGLAALSVESVLILLAVWQARRRTTPIALPPLPAARRTPEYSRLG
jgi:MFS family permease